MRELLLFQVTVLLGVSLALDLRHSGHHVQATIELQRNKRHASPTNLKANPFLQDDEDLRLSNQDPSTPLLSQGTPSSDGRLQFLTRSRRQAVDRVLSIFGGSLLSVSRPHHNRPNAWRPVHPRPDLGLKHHRALPHKGPHHVRGPKHHGPHPPKHHHGGGPHHQKFRGPPKHHGGGPHKHIDDHHILHDDHDEHHHHFEDHHVGEIHHDGGPIHHDDSHIHHDDSHMHHDDGQIHHDDSHIHHDDSHIHHDGGPIHHDSGAHHDGSDAHYDDHSINDIHDYPDHEYIVEYDDGGLVFGHHDHSFKPSLPDHKRPHHAPDYHNDPHHEPHIEPHHDNDEYLSHNPGHIASITKNNIYRDDVPFKEVINENDKVHDGLDPGGVKGLDPELISFITDKSRPYLIGGDY